MAGLVMEHQSVPSLRMLFSDFWTWDTLKQIYWETNCNTLEVIDIYGRRICGGPKWKPLVPNELRALMEVMIFMDAKPLPNMRAY